MKKGGATLVFVLLVSCIVLANNFQDFNQGTFSNTYYNGSSILLQGTNLTGNFTSKIFDASTLSLWNNLTLLGNSPNLTSLYAVDGSGAVYKSTNLGISWTQVTSNYGRGTVTSDLVYYNNSLLIMAGSTYEVWRSSDLGVTWTIVNDTFTNKALMNSKANRNSIYVIAGSVGEFWRSSDSGVTWDLQGDFNGAASNTAKGLVIDSNNNLFVVDSSGSIFKSSDSGVSWTTQNSSYGGTSGTDDLAVDSNNNLYILFNKAIYKSSNQGVSWTIINNSFTPYSQDGLKILGDNANLFIIDGPGRVWESINQGVSWTEIGDFNNGATNDNKGFNYAFQNSQASFQVRNCSQADCSDGIWQTLALKNINLTSRYFQYQVNLSRDTTSLNPSLNNITLDYTILNTAPSTSITLPLNTSYNSIQTALSYHVSDINNNLQTCKYSLNLGASNTTVNCGQNVSSLVSSQGNNIWQVWVNDTYGLQASSQVSFFVDSLLPQVEITSPVNNARTTDNQLNILHTASDTNLQSCKYSINGASNITTSCNQPITSAWNQGTNSIMVYAEDILGNINYSLTNFFVDSINPSLIITSPQSQASYGTNTSLELNFSARDTNLQACWWNIDSQANSSISCNQNTTFSISSGAHTINLFANDSLGNTATSQVTFEINIGAPTITLNSPINAYLINSLVNFTFTATDQDLDSCELWGNWTGWQMNQSKTVSSGILSSFTLNLTEGNYQWNIKCNDTSNHSSMNGNKSFSIDYTSPVVSLTDPSTSYSSKTGIPITFTISDTTNTRCYYNLSYQSSGAVIKQNTELLNCNQTSFDVDLDSSYIFWFFANDSSGNTVYINKNFTVSTPSTSPSTTSPGGGGSSYSSSGARKYFEISGDSQILTNAGESKILELKIKNKLSNFMNDCKIKSYSDWISNSKAIVDLSPGQSNEYILDLDIPKEVAPGMYNLSLSVQCEESSQNFTISMEVIEKKLGLVLVEATGIDGMLEINYTLKELSGKPQEIELQILLFKNSEKIAESKETQKLDVNEERSFKTKIKLEEPLSGTFNLVINANSAVASAFLQEEVIASNSKIGGLAVYLRENRTNSIVIIFLIAVFGVFAFFILKRIAQSRKMLKN